MRFKESRLVIRDKNAYLILRELHKVEKDPTNDKLIEGIVEVLIQ